MANPHKPTGARAREAGLRVIHALIELIAHLLVLSSVGLCEKAGVSMSALILKSANRLYKLFKFYSTMALLGALAAIVVQIVLAEPMVVLIATLMVVTTASTLVMLYAQSHEKSRHERKEDKPPLLPESLMIVSLPADIADQIIEDLRDEFHHLRSKYGRYSAVTWYTIQSSTIFIKAAALHCGLGFGKSLTQFLTKQSR